MKMRVIDDRAPWDIGTTVIVGDSDGEIHARLPEDDSRDTLYVNTDYLSPSSLEAVTLTALRAALAALGIEDNVVAIAQAIDLAIEEK